MGYEAQRLRFTHEEDEHPSHKKGLSLFVFSSIIHELFKVMEMSTKIESGMSTKRKITA
jgi:hypothetical protein